MVQKNLEMIRGDTFAFSLTVSETGDASITSVYFTVKRKNTDTENVFQKSLSSGVTEVSEGYYTVRVAPEDTSGVAAGSYVYDLQIGVGSDIYTILMGSFKIIQDVTTN